MMELPLVTKIAAGGIASLFIVMISLVLATWTMSIVAQRIEKRPGTKEPQKELEA